ncbi:MAG: ribonuclease E/G [Caulobacterales bacterium]|nr:ribonuclease E/G [Caulobacterales bacterium]
MSAPVNPGAGPRRLFIDAAIGETRALLTVAGRPHRLAVARWSEAGRRAERGEERVGRVRRVAEGLGGAFLDIGCGPDGFLPFRDGRRASDVREGAGLRVEVRAEAQAGKGPLLRRLPGAPAPGTTPGLLSVAPPAWERPAFAADGEAVVGAPAREAVDEAVTEALSREVPLPGGGSLAIEPTRALVAIDVDAGARPAREGPARLAFETNLAAAGEAARQLQLRSLAGLVAIDFLHMTSRPRRHEVQAALAAALADAEGRADVAPLSRFCVGEASLERGARPLHEALQDAEGAPSPETVALEALRALEREGAADRGARLTLRVAPEVAEWLEADHIDWRGLLAERLGARFAAEAVAGAARESIDVRSR